MAKKLKSNPNLGFEKDKRKSAVDKSANDVVPVERGIYRPLPKTKASTAKAPVAKKATKQTSAKLRKAKSVKSNFRKQLKKNQRQRRKTPKNRC